MKENRTAISFPKLPEYTAFTCHMYDAGVVMCLSQGADLHMAQLMPLTVCHSSKSRLVLPSWFYLSGANSPGYSRTRSKRALCGCVCWCVCVCVCDVWYNY